MLCVFAHRLRRLIRSEISLVWELLGWRSVWPMDLQLYSLIVGLMREARLCSATKASAKSSATPYTGGHFGVFYNRKSFLFTLSTFSYRFCHVHYCKHVIHKL